MKGKTAVVTVVLLLLERLRDRSISTFRANGFAQVDRDEVTGAVIECTRTTKSQGALIAAAALSALIPSGVLAQDASSEAHSSTPSTTAQESRRRTPNGQVDRGTRTRTLAAGWGSAWRFGIPGYGKTRTDATFLAFHPGLGWFVVDRFEVGGEATIFRYFHPRAAVTAGVAGLGARFHLTDRGRLVPFISGGAGFLWTSLDIPELDRVFNGQLYYGAGVRLLVAGNPSWRIEIRNHHISNAGTSGANLGLNAFVFLVGADWFLAPR